MKHLLVGVLAVALCATGAAARADNPTISLTIRNHQFEPAELQVPAGTVALFTT